MSFHSPHLLWLLVPLVLLFIWELARHTARAATQWPKIARAWAGAFQVSLGSAHTTAETRPRLWLWFGLALCLIALARPQWGVIEEKVFDQSREVIIAVDLSRSMLVQDVKPSRLDRSKLLISSLLDGLKGERVGLVLFAGTSFLQSPLSSDYEILREFLPELKPEYLPEGGSNYKAMLEASIQAFGTSTADRYLIILSDGESTEESWKDLGETLKTKAIRVIGLGLGTTQGGFIPDGSGGFVKDERGAVVLSRLNSSTLQELAQTSGGAYADASSWIDLAALLKQTVDAGKKGEFSEKNTARLLERFQWFLAPGLLLLLISFWAEFPVRPRERALPMGAAANRKNLPPLLAKNQTATAAASVVLAVFWLSTLSSQLSALSSQLSASAAEPPTDSLAGPLTTTVARLSAKDALNAKDCAELAETTLTFGQRLKSSQQLPPESVVRDALAAVDLGEQADAKAADWPKLRKELEQLLQKNEPPKQDQKKQDQQKQDQKNKDDQQKNDQQKQDQQDKDSKDQQKKDQQENPDQQKSDQQKQDEQKNESQEQKEPKDDAFGDMKEKDQPKPEPPKQPPSSGTQKVGGQTEKKPDATLDPELAVPLQKLEQVRNQDSPAKLQQLMQGKPQKPTPKGKDW